MAEMWQRWVWNWMGVGSGEMIPRSVSSVLEQAHLIPINQQFIYQENTQQPHWLFFTANCSIYQKMTLEVLITATIISPYLQDRYISCENHCSITHCSRRKNMASKRRQIQYCSAQYWNKNFNWDLILGSDHWQTEASPKGLNLLTDICFA